jgi:FKBP-type peptidyl-prolyl cis-trans isomerase
MHLFIPSALGYGSTAKTDIPANSVLIFEIELVEFY